MFLTDDYNYEGVLYTNFKEAVIKKWIAHFKFSKHCTIVHNPPIRVENKRPKEIDDRIREILPNHKRISAVILSREYKFNLKAFIEYLNERGYDIEFITREEYEQEHRIKKPFMLPRRKRK